MRIAFGHKARVGKDECCKYLKSRYNGDILAFSDTLYEVCYGIQKTLNSNQQKDPKLLQFIGEGFRKLYGEDIWVNKLVEKINPDNDTYVSDLRYPNEFQKLKDLGFITVKINRPNRIIDRDPNHISEIALDNYKFDYEIDNDGTLEDLYNKLNKLMGELYGKLTYPRLELS